jgi:hypothetical protein
LGNKKVEKLAYLYINSNLGNVIDEEASLQSNIDYCQQQLNDAELEDFIENYKEGTTSDDE